SEALAFVQALRAGLKGEQVGGEWSDLVKDLRDHRGESVVVAGGHLPEAVHAAVCLLNEEIGALGRTLSWNSAPSSLAVDGPGEIESALAEGVDVLVCLGVNPVYDWPGGGFEKLLKQAKLSVGHGLFEDETLSACDIALASSHNLESWNDAVGRFGIESLCQPVIGPLYESRQEAESLLKWTQLLAKQKGGDQKIGEIEDWHNYVQSQWQRRHFPKAKESQTLWEEALRTGVSVTLIETRRPRMRSSEAEQLAASGAEQGGEYELLILPDYGVYDGRFANSSWLQELPDPVTRLVWDNAAMVSPATAKKLGVSEGDLDHGDVVGDMLEITAGGKAIELGILIVPGMADGVIATTLGYGRTKGGEVGTGQGMNVAGWLGKGSQSESPWCRLDVGAKKSAQRYAMVRTQKTFDMGERAIALDGTVEEYERDRKNFIKHKKHMPAAANLYNDHDYSKGYQWAMSIDLNKCVGCNACVSACQAENNVAVVGKEECGKGREMHWLRIDRYHEGDSSNPKVHQQLMLCQHCENAPCETVCPVNATAHSPEGLNEMIYNRCVGTRYCANNCPYKVRRFNFFDYTQRNQRAAEQELLFNPQVTVRSRGVMEKCTFCVQRINAAKYTARNSGDESAIGELQTACQQVCPAGAIVFGDKNNPASKTAERLGTDLNYYVLEELNVKPRVGYMAQIRNPVSG
ncbi:MAG: 4Fe-4S dicluster domain-containing protein, partial [Planctomycetes bacterium]|nr:4Fe-4S dicluster domain-containing protein [Planctomycetota bacterium]